MKTLMIDIETAPNLAWVWDLWNQNIGLSQLVMPKDLLCVATEWVDRPYRKEFHAVWQTGGKSAMVSRVHELLSEADAVVHYNGQRFDIPHLRAAFFEAGLMPPEPFRQIDLYRVVRSQFALPSKKLAYVTEWAGLPTKQDTGGFRLWTDVMAGKPAAQRKMQRYCQNDVTIMRDLYHRMLPWIDGHPNVQLYGAGAGACPKCGAGGTLQARGYRVTLVGRYRRFQCQKCGGWSSSGKREVGVDLR